MMLGDHIRLFFKLYYNPLAAMSQLIDKGRWLYGAAAVLTLSLALQFIATQNQRLVINKPIQPASQSGNSSGIERERLRIDERSEEKEMADPGTSPPTTRPPFWLLALRLFFPPADWMTVFALALLYVPATILAISLFEDIGSFSVAFNRDYGALLACTLMAWAAAHLPIVVIGFAITGSEILRVILPIAVIVSKIYFAFLMICALRRVCGARYGRAVAAISVSWMGTLLRSLLWFLASPFLLFFLWRYLSSEAAGLGAIFSGRQSFRRHLEAAMLNPSDAEARYQLGLIYQQRRQYAEAINYFKQAVEINNRETDAHYQLGCLARLEGRLQEAINHFNEVVTQDDKHAHHEVWREIGATYLAAGMLPDALAALEKFIERRPYDPEGLFHLGVTLQKSTRPTEAASMFKRCIEAANTKMYDRRGQSRRWGRQAEKQLRSTITPTAN
jgi:tetratricopeptide (TPR) repeat protein